MGAKTKATTTPAVSPPEWEALSLAQSHARMQRGYAAMRRRMILHVQKEAIRFLTGNATAAPGNGSRVVHAPGNPGGGEAGRAPRTANADGNDSRAQ